MPQPSCQVVVMPLIPVTLQVHPGQGEPLLAKKSKLERVLRIKEVFYGSDHVEVSSPLPYDSLGDHGTAKLMLERNIQHPIRSVQSCPNSTILHKLYEMCLDH
eukprot:PhF_6_TR7171/c0_g1_i1/m.10729